MPRLLYSNLGTGKQLNEIVMAGSHDAAINQGGENEKTQELDILHQGKAGVRFFDIRINARDLGGGDAELTAFHGPSVAKGLLAPSKNQSRNLTDLPGRNRQVTTTNLKAGTWGLGLTKILQDAKAFVTNGHYSSEFLILKFDKSTNYTRIAQTCVNELGANLYSAGGNLNTKTLADLAGRVIIVFPPDSHNEIYPYYTHLGILVWKNLYKPPAGYANVFDGLQYWGAGGTKINNKNVEGKIQENISTQKDIMKKASTGVQDKTKKKGLRRRKVVVTLGCGVADPNAIGMMYWTTTGVFKSIEARNNQLWNNNNIGGLREVWESGFFEYMNEALPNNVEMASFSSGAMLKTFMPNIVMIDFADGDKCKHIYKLNEIAKTEIVLAARKHYGLEIE